MADEDILEFYQSHREWLEDTATSGSRVVSSICLAVIKRAEKIKEGKR